MLKASLSFVLLFCSVISAASADYAQAKQFANRNQQLVNRSTDDDDCRRGCKGYEDCGPGKLPPSFKTPPASITPAQLAPVVTAVASDSDDTKMSLLTILTLIVGGLCAVGGLFSAKHAQDEIDVHVAQVKAEKEKAFRERAIKISAAPHVAS